MKRIRRLLRQPQGLALAPSLSAGMVTMVVAGALIAWQASRAAQNQQGPSSQQKVSPDTRQAKVSPYTAWLEADVFYIIDDRERAVFLSLRSDQEREHFIEQFWLRRDPTPGTPENEMKSEHYRRIAYANQRFPWRSMPGWKTDRGRTYIVYGPPDEIERHPSGRPAAGEAPAIHYPFEQWRFKSIEGVGNNVIIHFADEAKTGDVRMSTDPRGKSGTEFVPRPPRRRTR